MNLNKITYAGIVIVALGVAGCNKNSAYKPTPIKKVETVTLKPGEESTLLPIAVGNQWVYEADTSMQQQGRPGQTITSELTFRISTVQEIPDGKRFTMEILNNNTLAETQIWQMTSKGIFQVQAGAKKIPYTPPQTVIQFPVSTGMKFEWKGTGLTGGGQMGSTVQKNTILATQEVDTGLGRMSAIPVESRADSTAPNQKDPKTPIKIQTATVLWFAPKIGIVRYRQELAAPGTTAGQTLRLKQYTIK